MKSDSLTRFPLLSLRHVEAAVRLGSFDLAAQELNVTPSAVSQQIKRVETGLGQPLFERSANRVIPNARARVLGGILSDAFEMIGGGLSQASGETGEDAVKIRLYQTWANRWLVPRLERFTRQYPEIAVEFETGMDPVDFSRSDADLVLAMPTSQPRMAKGEQVMVPRLCPVCAPSLAGRLRSLEDLGHVPRIASRNRMDDWQHWLEATAQPQIDQRPLLVFSNSTLVYESALSGAGVAIAQVELVLSDLQNGRLVRPFSMTVPADAPAFLFEPEMRRRRSPVRKFRSWLLQEIEDLVARADAYLGA